MLFTDAVYVGINPTTIGRPICYAAIDSQLRLIALAKEELPEVMAFVGGLEEAVVAVDAPQSLRQGLMQMPLVRKRYNLRPEGKTWTSWKVCEFELRRRNIRMHATPTDYEESPGWMQCGLKIYRQLRKMDFEFFINGDEIVPRWMLETRPHACYTVLLGKRPFLKRTLEGRMQRQLVLYVEGFDIPDPLHALEEITRHHLLSSHLPLADLYDPDQLDAMVAAYTAYRVGVKPDQVVQVGDWEEGLITLPTDKLKDFYP